MRAVSSVVGSKVMFTLFQVASMSDEKFAKAMGMVEQNLGMLKRVLKGEV